MFISSGHVSEASYISSGSIEDKAKPNALLGAAATLAPVIQSIIGLILPSTLIMPRDSDLPADPTPKPPGELARKLKSLVRGDSRTLAASSSAIALSIASPFYDTRDASSDESLAQGRDTGWKTAYDTARMAVEITKESSDMFLPLKAVMGAISVLIKNYDVGLSSMYQISPNPTPASHSSKHRITWRW